MFISLHGVSTIRAVVRTDSAALSSIMHSSSVRGLVLPINRYSTVTVISDFSELVLPACNLFDRFVFFE